jgi:dihydrofolate reductase
MRIMITDFISLDGVVQAPGGPEEDTDGGFTNGGWSHPFFDEEVMGPAIDAALKESDALLFGRVTWQNMAAAWPGRAGDPFADQMNEIPKFVASRTLSPEEAARRWSNTTLLEGDAIDEVRRLRSEGQTLQIWGSSDLARQLVAAGLVDEFRLMIEPILLGGGKSIFPTDGVARTLQLVSVEQARTGTLVCTYRSVEP